MKTAQAPLVTFDGLTDSALPAVMNIPRTRAEMPKSGWLEWLECHNRFRFENSNGGKFTAYKSDKGYWTAQRRVQGKLRHEYLGTSSDLTYELLDQAAIKMDMCSSAYWRKKYPDPRTEQKINAESHKGKKYETISESSAQNAAEIEELKRQVAELELKLTSNTEELKQLQYRSADLQNENNRLTRLGNKINLTGIKTYKLHGREVVRIEDLQKLSS